ncbi:MAG: hypothetical protein ACRDTR_06050, partial [Rubrobacter sp.]
YVGVKIAFISAILAIFSGLAFVVGQSLNVLQAGLLPLYIPGWVNTVPFIAGQLITLTGTLIILSTARTALRTWTRVRNFTEYERSVEGILRNQ